MTLNDINDERTKTAIRTIEKYGPLVEEFLKSELGIYLMGSINSIHDEHVYRADNSDDSSIRLREYDRASAVREVIEMINYPLKAMEDGTLEELKKDI